MRVCWSLREGSLSRNVHLGERATSTILLYWSDEDLSCCGNGEPCLGPEKELRSLVACKRLAWKADKATLSNDVKPRPGPNGMTILSATLRMSSTLHLRIEQGTCAPAL